jgi:hypothetical protein
VRAGLRIPTAEKGSTPPALFFICPLGRLERVDLLRRFFDIDLEMGGCGTFSGPPFAGRIRINAAVFARRALDHLAATLALVDDDIAGAPVESAAFLRHETALDSVFNRLTNHDSLLFLSPVVDMSNSKKTDPLPKPCSWPSQVGHSLSLKACLAIKNQNGCQEKNVLNPISPES